MDAIETALQDACEDQRDALRKYRLSGSEADAARVHFESCPSCLRALETIAARRDARPGGFLEGSRPWVVAVYVGSRLLPVAAIAALVFAAGAHIADGRNGAMTEAERAESRVRYVRMPGRPDICVAEYPGHRGYGPTYLGAARCDQVSERVESGEGSADGLREHVIVRIRATGMCLAHAPRGDNDFTFPCGD